MEACDVVVVGAGFAGLAGALEAAKAGARVFLLGQKNPLATNSAIGGGAFALACTPFQKQQGIGDSEDLFAQDLLRANRRSLPEDIVMAAVRESLQLYDWMKEIGAQFYCLIEFPGHSVPRVHLENGISGANTVKLLLQAVERNGVEVWLDTMAQHLVMGRMNEVNGVLAVSGEKTIEIEAKKGVVLAAGGFGNNKNMVARYLPPLIDAPSLSAIGSTGDGIRMGAEIGADLSHMDSAVMTSLGSAEKKGYRILGISETLTQGAIMVNKKGERFTDESKGYGETVLPVMGQPGGVAFLVFDERILQKTEKVKRYTNDYLKEGLFLYGSTADEIARKAGIDEGCFRRTIEQYYPLAGLYGTWIKPAVMMTHGGLRINARTQVIHQRGFPIPRLFAAGDNTPGLGGSAIENCYCPGYLTGCGYLWALASGRIAGRNVAAG